MKTRRQTKAKVGKNNANEAQLPSENSTPVHTKRHSIKRKSKKASKNKDFSVKNSEIKNDEKMVQDETLNQLEVENLNLNEKVNEFEQKLSELLKINQNLKHKNSDFKTSISDFKKKVKKLEKKESSAKEQKTANESDIKKLKLDIKDKEKHIGNFLKREKSLVDRKNTLEKEVKEETDKLMSLRKEKLQKEVDAQNSETKLQKYKDQNMENEGLITDLKQKVKTLRDDINRYDEEAISAKTEFNRNKMHSEKENESLSEEISALKDEISTLKAENSESVKKLSKISSDMTLKINAKIEEVKTLTLTETLQKNEIKLLKESTKNYEDQIRLLKEDKLEKESIILKEQMEKTQQENENQILKSELESKTLNKSESRLIDTIKEMSGLEPESDNPDAEIEFNSTGHESTDEMLIRYVTLFDVYKKCLREKNAYELAIKRISRHNEIEIPSVKNQLIRHEMLKSSFVKITKRYSILQQKFLKSQNVLKLRNKKICNMNAKMNATKESTKVLKTQIQTLLHKNSENSDFTFKDVKIMHKKFLKLFTKYESEKAIWDKEKEELSDEKKGIMDSFNKSRDKWLQESEENRKEIKSMAVKINNIGNSSNDKDVTDAGEDIDVKYSNMFETLNKNLSSITKDKVESIAKAEEATRKIESEMTKIKTEKNLMQNELNHEKTVREIAEQQQKQIDNDLRDEREQRSKLEESLREAKESKNEFEIRFNGEREKIITLRSELEYNKGMMSALENSEKRTLEKVAEKQDFIKTYLAKIERLEETNRILSESEKSKVVKLMEEKQELEIEWQDLKKMRELDARSARGALESSNSLARKALDELKRENENSKTIENAKEMLQSRLAESTKKLEENESTIKDLLGYKKRVEEADLEIIEDGSDLDKQSSIKIGLSVQKIVDYERKIDELKANSKSLNEIMKSKTELYKNLNNKSRKEVKETKAKLDSLTEKHEKAMQRLYKVTAAYQSSSIESGKITNEIEHLKLKINSVQLQKAKDENETKKIINDFEVRSKSLFESILEKDQNNNLIRQNYEMEVKRHGDTINKMSDINEQNKRLEIELSTFNAKYTESEKQLESLKAVNRNLNETTDNITSDLNKKIDAFKNKCGVLSDELDCTNSLNRYLKKKANLDNPFSEENDVDVTESSENLTADQSLENYKVLLAESRKESEIIERKMKKSEEKADAYATQLSLKTHTVLDLKSQLQQSIEKMIKLEAELVEKSKSGEAKDLENQILILKENNDSLRNRLNNAIKEKTDLKIEISDLEKAHGPGKSKLNELTENIKYLQASLELKTSLAQNWEKRCLKIFEFYIQPEEYQKVQDELKSAKGRLENIESASSEEKAKIEKEVCLLNDQIDRHKKSLKEINNQMEAIKAENLKLTQNVFQMEREKMVATPFNAKLSAEEKKNEEKLDALKSDCNKMMIELEKYKLLVRKLDSILKDEKETSQIYKRNAQTANARIYEKQNELQVLAKKLAENVNEKTDSNLNETSEISAQPQNSSLITENKADALKAASDREQVQSSNKSETETEQESDSNNTASKPEWGNEFAIEPKNVTWSEPEVKKTLSKPAETAVNKADDDKKKDLANLDLNKLDSKMFYKFFGFNFTRSNKPKETEAADQGKKLKVEDNKQDSIAVVKEANKPVESPSNQTEPSEGVVKLPESSKSIESVQTPDKLSEVPASKPVESSPVVQPNFKADSTGIFNLGGFNKQSEKPLVQNEKLWSSLIEKSKEPSILDSFLKKIKSADGNSNKDLELFKEPSSSTINPTEPKTEDNADTEIKKISVGSKRKSFRGRQEKPESPEKVSKKAETNDVETENKLDAFSRNNAGVFDNFKFGKSDWMKLTDISSKSPFSYSGSLFGAPKQEETENVDSPVTDENKLSEESDLSQKSDGEVDEEIPEVNEEVVIDDTSDENRILEDENEPPKSESLFFEDEGQTSKNIIESISSAPEADDADVLEISDESDANETGDDNEE